MDKQRLIIVFLALKCAYEDFNSKGKKFSLDQLVMLAKEYGGAKKLTVQEILATMKVPVGEFFI